MSFAWPLAVADDPHALRCKEAASPCPLVTASDGADLSAMASNTHSDTHALSGPAAMGHALAGTLLLMACTMTGVQDVVAAFGGSTGTLLAVHCGTLLMLTWCAAQVTLLSESIDRVGGSLVVHRVTFAMVARRWAGRWALRGLALLALHLALGWLGGGWS